MTTTQDWVTYQCACGFRLERVPRTVVSELTRCLGCGRSLRAPARPKTSSFTNVKNLR